MKSRWRMPPTPMTSSSVCRASRPPATCPATQCNRPASAPGVKRDPPELGRARARPFLFGIENQEGPATPAPTTLGAARRIFSRLPVRLVQHQQRILQRRDIEHHVQVGAVQHVANKRLRIHQLKLDTAFARPVMQRNQRSQPSRIERIHFRKIQHHDARIALANRRRTQCPHRFASHNAPRAPHHYHVSSSFHIHGQHDLLLRCFSKLDGSLPRRSPPSNEIPFPGRRTAPTSCAYVTCAYHSR